MNKMIFMCTALGHQKNFIATQTESIFRIPQSEKRLYFGLGNLTKIDTTTQTWNNVNSTIKEHLDLFPNRTLIYYGWEVLEFFNELRLEYPEGLFYGVRIVDSYIEHTISEWIANSHDVGINESILRDRLARHNNTLDNMWNNKQDITIDSQYTSENRKCFFIK